MSGLSGMYIWSGVFGYLYSSLGWFTPVYMFGIGLLIGWAWNAFRRAYIWGLVIYPWFGFTILFWIAWNIIFSGMIVTLMVSWMLLVAYEKISPMTAVAPAVNEIAAG